MQHGRKKSNKLNMKSGHRNSVFSNLMCQLISHGRIKTTEVKAKQLVKQADKIITTAKKQTLAAKRAAVSVLKDKKAVKKLFSEIVKHFENRKGGYCRAIKTTYRRGDAAPLAIVELIDFQPVIGAGKKTKSKNKDKDSKDSKPKAK
ncbi:MAG: 50S ribosomal protein L17 [bacterium]|nr:50S ribosomal protein L17 [bacterium]